MKQQRSPWRSHLSPLRFFVVMIAAVLVGEALEVAFPGLLHPGWHPVLQTVAYSLLHAVIIAPLLWWFAVIPLRKAALAQRLRAAAIEAAANAIVITKRDGTITWINRAFTEMTGYSLEEAIGNNPRILKSGEHDASFYRKLWGTVLSGKVWSGVMINRRKGGSVYTEEQTITPVLNERGKVDSFIAIKQDITKRIRAQEALRDTEEKLRQTQKMEALGRLASGVAHDFSNLLVVINGYSGSMLSRIEQNHPFRKQLTEIHKAGERAVSLTRQLLTFSHRKPLEAKVLDLNTIVIDSEKLLRRLIGEDIDLVTKLEADLGCVKSDPGQIEQIIMNLAINARDAMERGGKLTIETANVDLSEAYARRHLAVCPGRYVMLAVSDNGCGMDPKTLTKVFNPFFTTKGEGKGTGLGLSVVYGIVKQSEGNIWVYSEPGRGTTFKIYLPKVDEPLEIVKTTQTVAELKHGRETILLVEDEQAVRRLTCQILKENGYTVLEARDGDEALRILKQYESKIHLILTDVVMPKVDGPALIQRARPLRPETKVLYMSGYTGNAIVHHGVLDAGVSFLPKPFTPDSLAIKLRQVLRANPAKNDGHTGPSVTH